MNTKLIIGISTALILGACATKPEPIVEAAPPPVAAPVEIAPAPAPAPVVEQAPVIAPVIVNPNSNIPGSAGDFAYVSGGEPRVFFAYNQYRLSPEAINSLRSQAEWLKIYSQVTAVIEGNADERGTREYNLALAARRAEAVKSYLVGQGVAAARLTTVSYGKERPIDARSNEAGWARNRNGHTNLMSGTIG